MAIMNILLSKRMETRVAALASARGETAEALAIEALERLLDDEADLSEINDRMAHFAETGQAFEHEDVLAKLRIRAEGQTDTK